MEINPKEILVHTTDLVTILDRDGMIRYTSPSCLDILGYAPETLEGTSIFELVHQEDQKFVNEKMDEGFSGKKPTSLRYRVKHKSGGYTWLESSGNGKNLESYDQPMRLVTSRDISKQVQVEQELIKGETRFRHVLEAAQDAIVLMDENGSISGWNKSAERIFGYHSDEVLGKDLHSTLCPNHYHSQYERNLFQFQKTGKGMAIGKTVELQGIKRNGTVFPIELSLSAFKQDDGFHAVGIVRDISDRKAVENKLIASKERAEKANASKNAFLSNMSHELRTPLHGILGMLTMMDELVVSEEQKELLAYTNDSANHLLDLVDDLLRLSKLHNGTEVLKEVVFDFQQMINASIDPFFRLLEVKQIDFRVSGEDLSNVMVIGDQDKLVKTICHLLRNAIKFTKEGTVEIVSFLKEYTEDVGVFRIEIKDTGIGVAYGHVPSLFDPFYQVDDGSKKVYGGVGVGLPMARQYIEMMGGHMDVISTKGEGSTFYFEVPLNITEDSRRALEQLGKNLKRGRKIKPFESSLKLLLADDDKPTRVLMKKVFHSLNIDADFVEDGLDAVQYYTHKRYDLILMDIQMPMMDGFDAVQLIREYEREIGQYTPIIALLCYRTDESVNKLHAQGFDDLLTKPIELEKIYEAVVYWINPAHRMR